MNFTFDTIIEDLKKRREGILNGEFEKRKKSLGDVINEGYDNNIINAYKAYARGEKKFQLTNNSFLEWDDEVKGWTIKYKKDIGTMFFSDVNDLARIWDNTRQMETLIEYTISDNRYELDIFK